jgi:hypothetical protein
MSDRAAFEKWWPSVGQTIGKVAAWEAWQAAQAQVSDEVLAELDKLSNRNYELRMENADLKSKLQGIPVAVRFGWDGDGYQYMDNGSGSDWKTRIPDAELLYAHPQPYPRPRQTRRQQLISAGIPAHDFDGINDPDLDESADYSPSLSPQPMPGPFSVTARWRRMDDSEIPF